MHTAKATIKINAKVESVWDALTNPDKIEKYLYGTKTITDWIEGSPIIFKGNYQGKDYKDKGEIRRVIPNKYIEYTFFSSFSDLEDKPENYSLVTYEIDKNESNIILTISQHNLPNEELAEHTRESWEKIVNEIKEMTES